MGVWYQAACCRLDDHKRIISVILAIARGQDHSAYLEVCHSLILLNGSMVWQHLGALLAIPL